MSTDLRQLDEHQLDFYCNLTKIEDPVKKYKDKRGSKKSPLDVINYWKFNFSPYSDKNYGYKIFGG